MINHGVLTDVAIKLNSLDLKYAFVGGSVVEFLLDNQALSPVRPTDDLDVIVEVLSNRRYSEIEQMLRSVGFEHDITQGAPICRWLHNGIKVDVMPTNGVFIGLNTQWFSEALDSAKYQIVRGVNIPLISPVAFIATKLAAFVDRGEGDYYGSHDLEDIIAIIDGRQAIIEEIAGAPTGLRSYIISSFKLLRENADFQEALPGHLPFDSASQRRLPGLRLKLINIANLA